MTDGRQIVQPGDKNGIATEGADPKRIVAQVQFYNGKDTPTKDFHLEPILAMSSHLFVDGISKGPIQGYVYPAKYKERHGFRTHQPKVELVSFAQEVTTLSAGFTVQVKVVEGSEGFAALNGTVRLLVKFADVYINKITNLFNSSFATTISVLGNPGESCKYLTAEDLQKLITVHVQDVVRSVISPNAYMYSELERIEVAITEKLGDDPFFAEIGLMAVTSSIRIDMTPLERIESAEVDAYITQRYRQLELQDKINDAKFKEEIEALKRRTQ